MIRLRGVLCLALLWMGCPADPPAPEPMPAGESWSELAGGLDEALLAISGLSERDVWTVGADRGKGPLVLRYDGQRWTRKDTGTRGHLWWVHALDERNVFLAGEAATVLRWDGTRFERMTTPGRAAHMVFGVWARTAEDVWAVGSRAGRAGFIWHFDGQAWREIELPPDLPGVNDTNDGPGLFKVWGDAEGTVWVVGDRGMVLAGRDGRFERVPMEGAASTLFTVHGRGADVVAVGGQGTAALLERNAEGAFVDRSPEAAPLLQGVFIDATGRGFATGAGGLVYERRSDGWVETETGLWLGADSLHAVWVDPSGAVWTVGGNVLSSLDRGVIWRRGDSTVPGHRPEPDPDVPEAPTCPVEEIDPAPNGTIARRWNEQALGAIRRDLPHPGVHARNLFHLSAALWDAWAHYDPAADGYVHREKGTAADLEAARHEAMSHAAFGVLTHRYRTGVGGKTSLACFQAFMDRLGYPTGDPSEEGNAPRAVGNRIARKMIEAFREDGANEAGGYADTTGYLSPNPPLYVDAPGTECAEPERWQPLNLSVAETQNGILLSSGLQTYLGAHWESVRPFALERTAPSRPYFETQFDGSLDQPHLKAWVVDLLRRSAEVGAAESEWIDISPGALGNNPLGSDEGRGHPANPATGAAYPPNLVPRSDFARVLAEFWADGPHSETPPGHWNVLANESSEHPAWKRRFAGEGPELGPLEWDVKLYFALNGALHDAAIAAWEQKRVHTSARPITLVRYMGGLGQSSAPAAPSYHPHGLPLVPGLVELVTPESARTGSRHAHLARYLGQVAVRGWRGEPGDRATEVGGVDWVRAIDWIPYQRRTFVTPAFPGYVSGHSTFSRAAAEVLSAFTGSPSFPGGLGEFVARPSAYLNFEQGPSVEVRLQWATWYDAADQAGQSRIFGGIHVLPDDHDGRRIGAEVGKRAFARARKWFEGSAVER